jgi:RimJ/RimL family protein N-acetyltransferase
MFVPVISDNHIETVESLAREIWTEHYTPMIGSAQVDYMLGHFQSRKAISGQIKAGSLYFLIRETGVFIGYLAVEPKADELFLSKVYVMRSKRGKGYGRKAVQFVETLAREGNFGRIALTVNKNNTDSIKAYEKLGFRNTGALVQDIGSGFVMDDYRMEKAVTAE